MPHPLSTIITAKLNGDDPHARTTITNAEAIHIRDWLNESESVINGAICKIQDGSPHHAESMLDSLLGVEAPQ